MHNYVMMMNLLPNSAHHFSIVDSIGNTTCMCMCLILNSAHHRPYIGNENVATRKP